MVTFWVRSAYVPPIFLLNCWRFAPFPRKLAGLPLPGFERTRMACTEFPPARPFYGLRPRPSMIAAYIFDRLGRTERHLLWNSDNKRLFHDSAIAQKLDGSFLLTMLPHQGNDYLLFIDIFN